MSQLTLTEDLVLLSLTRDKGNGLTPSEIAKALKPHFDRRKADLATALKRLSVMQMVEEAPRKKSQRAVRWKLLALGKKGMETHFASVKFAGRFAMRNSICFLFAVRALQLPRGAAKTMLEGDGVLAYFLAAKVGETFDANTSVKGLASLVAAKTLKISSGKPDFIWGHLVQQGIANQDSPNVARANGKTETSPATVESDDAATQKSGEFAPIAEFAEQVMQAARTAKDGWFGPTKLFIHRAWETWKQKSGRDTDLQTFKRRLIEALQSNYVELSRADLPTSIEASDAEAALTRHGEETYHFLVVNEAQR